LIPKSQLVIWAAEVGVSDKTVRVWERLALRAGQAERERVLKIIDERWMQSHAGEGGGFVRAELEKLTRLIKDAP